MTVDLYRFGSSATDASETIYFLLEPNPIAPTGVGGECLFRNIYLTITYNAVFELTLIPIIDGNELLSEAFTWVVTTSRDDPITEVFEFGLGRSYPNYASPRSRYGIRGTWFSFRIEGRDLAQICGVIELEGTEIEYEVLREGLPHRGFSVRELAEPRQFEDVRFMFGGNTASDVPLYQFGRGEDDAGTAIDLFAQPNIIAPAGIGVDHLYTNIYLTVTHDNLFDYSLIVTPIIDNTALDPITVTILGALEPTVGAVYEIGLSREWVTPNVTTRYGIRGTWFTFRVEGDGTVPVGTIIIEGADVEYEVLRETKRHINAPSYSTTPAERVKTTGLNALILSPNRTVSTSLDAIIQRQLRLVTLGLDAIVTTTPTISAALDAALRRRRITVAAELDATLTKAATTKTASLNAILQKQNDLRTIALDAILATSGTPWTGTAVLQLDAIIKALNDTVSTSLTAAIQKRGITPTVGLNAVLKGATSAVAYLDARLTNQTISYIRADDYADTTALKADSKLAFPQNPQLVELVTDGVLGKAIRYQFWRCDCNTQWVQMDLDLPGSYSEVWLYSRFRFSSNWHVYDPPNDRYYPGSPYGDRDCKPGDWKMWFLLPADRSGRWSLKAGLNPVGTQVAYFQTSTPPSGEANIAYGPWCDQGPYNIWDGAVHEIMWHVKYGTTTSSADGVIQVWIDGGLAIDRQDLVITNNSPINQLSVGRNMSGPSGLYPWDSDSSRPIMYAYWKEFELYAADPGFVVKGGLTYNEPAGYVQFASHNLDALPPFGFSPPGNACSHSGLLDGCAWWSYNSGCPSDTIALESGRAKVEIAAGTAGGNCDTFPGINIWDTASELSSTRYDEIYVRFKYQLGETTHFELGGIKLWGFWGVGEWGDNNSTLYAAIEHFGSVADRTGPFSITLFHQNFLTWSLSQGNSGGGFGATTTAQLLPGVEHDVEMVMKINDIGSANGWWQVWIDGTKIHDHRDVEFRTVAEPDGFFFWKTNGTWQGGQPADPPSKSDTDYIYYDELYISGIAS